MGQNILAYHANSILVEAWDTFKIFTRNIIRYSFIKTKLLPFNSDSFSTKTHSCVAFVQVFSVAKVEGINDISYCAGGPINVQKSVHIILKF